MRTSLHLIIVALVSLILSAVAAPAHALTREEHPGTERTGGMGGIPGRIEVDVPPGGTEVTRVGFHNKSGRTMRVTVHEIDVSGSTDPRNFLQLVEEAKYGASSWLELAPGERRFDFQHGDVVYLDVKIHVPANASPGTHYAALRAVPDAPPAQAGAGGLQVASVAAVAVQIFVTVPGDIEYGGTIRRTESPRLLQRTQGSYAAVSAVYENTGNVTDAVGGAATMHNIFGKKVAEFPMQRVMVIRGSAREMRVLWTDPPWIGRFTPVITLTGKSGEPVTKELDPIWIVPSWKYWALVLGTLMIPLVQWYRNRNRWQDYLEDEDWDDEWDDDLVEDEDGTYGY